MLLTHFLRWTLYDVALPILSGSCRLSQIEKILAAEYSLQTLIDMPLLLRTLPLRQYHVLLLTQTGFATRLREEMMTLVLPKVFLRRVISDQLLDRA